MQQERGRMVGWIDGPESSERLFRSIMEVEADLESEPGLPQIEGYFLVRRLGSGGAGDVFNVARKGSDRPLALKLLREPLGGEETAKRLWRELDLLSQIDLPVVPRVHDYGVHEGRLYIVTDLVDGLPLAAHCEAHGLDLRARVELMATLAEAVQSLHERGILHRDLKPSNVLVDHYGHPVVIDFGLARFTRPDESSHVTGGGAVLGSPAFMAPEQARGERTVSTRTDVYGIAATALFVLSGRTVRDATAPVHEVIYRAAREPAPSVASRAPQLPKPLVSILAQALAFDPNDRYATAREIAEEFRRWLRDEPVHASRPSVLTRVRLYTRRHPARCVVAGLAVLLLLLTMAAVAWAVSETALRKESQRVAAERAELLVERERMADEQQAYAERLREGRIRTRDTILTGIEHSRRAVTMANEDPALRQEMSLQAIFMLGALGRLIQEGDVQGEEVITAYADAVQELLALFIDESTTSKE